MKSFNSKILLFGEYSLLKGSMGLAIPYPSYSGKLVLPDDKAILTRQQLESNSVIKKLAVDILHKEPYASKPHVYTFLEDTLLGLYFDSNIPNNYGVGSSGTLVASIYDRYFGSSNNIHIDNHRWIITLKRELALMESYFHGTSSGIDPLVSFINAPILLNSPANHFTFQIPDNIKVFLIDSGQPGNTKDFVQIFNKKSEKHFNQLKVFIRKNNECIIAFLEQQSNFFNKVQEFCELEYQFLSKMFVQGETIFNIVKNHNTDLCIKLCGSGGGGFLLGIARNETFSTIKKNFSENNIPIELVDAQPNELINL